MPFQCHHVGRSAFGISSVSCAWSPKIGLRALFPPHFSTRSNMCSSQKIIGKETPEPSREVGRGNWSSRMLGQPGSKVHPGRVLSWPIGIVNEGRTTLCSPRLQLPTSVTCYFSQVIKPIQPGLPGDRGDNPPLCGEGGRGEEVPRADSEPQRHL